MRTAGRIGRTVSGIMMGIVCLMAAFYMIGIYEFGWAPIAIFREIGLLRLLISLILICGVVGEIFKGKIVGALVLCIPLICLYRGILGITMDIITIVIVGALICVAINLILPRGWKNGWYGIKEESTKVHDNVESDMNGSTRENINAGDNRVVDISMSFGSTVKYVEGENLRVVNIHNSFGAVEVHLDKANIKSDLIEINISQEFAATTLVVPYDWQLDNQMQLFAAGVEDKPVSYNSNVVSGTRVVLKGRASFAGIKIQRI